MKNRTEPYLATWLHTQGAKKGLPIAGNFELTARCNFNCPMCYVHLSNEQVEKAGKELTTEQWIRLAEEAKEQGMVFALLTGGEPFVRKDFFEIYAAMKKMGIMVSINSNASMLSGEIRRRLIDDPPSRMNISIYGGQNKTYQNMCGQPVFEDVIENIREIKAAGIDVRINLSITQYNCQDIEKIYNISRDLGVHVKAASYMYPPVRVEGHKEAVGKRMTPEESARYSLEWDKIRFTQDELMKRAENITALVSDESGECGMDVDEGVRCRAGSSSFWITWDGRMLPCGMMKEPVAYPLQTGFKDAWKQIIEETKKIRIPKECTTCVKRDVCNICAAVCAAETGTFAGVPRYMCQKADHTINLMRSLREGREGEQDCR